MSGKRKRTNKNRIPLAPKAINAELLIAEVSVGNMFYAWLLVIPVLIEQGYATRERILELWDATNDYISNPQVVAGSVSAPTKYISNIIGLPEPYPAIDFRAVHTEGDLEAIRRKLKKNALHAGLCIIALGMKALDLYSNEDLRSIFFNVDLTLAEIDRGVTSYDKLLETVQGYGIRLSQGASDMELSLAEGTSSPESDNLGAP